jgi:glucose-6-phosphate isomerase
MKKNLNSGILESVKSLALLNKNLHIKDLLKKNRLEKFKINTDLLSFDYSKQRITAEVLEELLKIPEIIGLSKSMQQISKGGNLNLTERRKVSHMLYRKTEEGALQEDLKLIIKEKNRLKIFIDKTINNNNFIKDIVSIGIGGSRLGPELLSQSFGGYSGKRVHYCCSYDLTELEEILSLCNPTSTLFIISSKSFDTPEVLDNAFKAKEWLNSSNLQDISGHLVGVSSNLDRMKEFGIRSSNQFKIFDSLGGRFSIWSSISLPAILDMEMANFEEFREGGLLADEHFLNSSWKNNIPVLMAILSLWNLNGLGIENLGIFSYDYRLRSLPKYLSQLIMESNGKTITTENKKTPFQTCPLVWGGYGPEAQHSLFQWLYQGTGKSSCDFIGICSKEKGMSNSYNMLLSQIAALSIGEENSKELHKAVEGNNPISLLRLNSLTPKSLGFLIACYEHKVFVESLIYEINAFDQWGVQLGKKLTKEIKKDQNLLEKYFDNDFIS